MCTFLGVQVISPNQVIFSDIQGNVGLNRTPYFGELKTADKTATGNIDACGKTGWKGSYERHNSLHH